MRQPRNRGTNQTRVLLGTISEKGVRKLGIEAFEEKLKVTIRGQEYERHQMRTSDDNQWDISIGLGKIGRQEWNELRRERLDASIKELRAKAITDEEEQSITVKVHQGIQKAQLGKALVERVKTVRIV